MASPTDEHLLHAVKHLPWLRQLCTSVKDLECLLCQHKNPVDERCGQKYGSTDIVCKLCQDFMSAQLSRIRQRRAPGSQAARGKLQRHGLTRGPRKSLLRYLGVRSSTPDITKIGAGIIGGAQTPEFKQECEGKQKNVCSLRRTVRQLLLQFADKLRVLEGYAEEFLLLREVPQPTIQLGHRSRLGKRGPIQPSDSGCSTPLSTINSCSSSMETDSCNLASPMDMIGLDLECSFSDDALFPFDLSIGLDDLPMLQDDWFAAPATTELPMALAELPPSDDAFVTV